MEDNKYKILVQKYLQGTASAEERELIESWYLKESSAEVGETGNPDYELVKKQIWNNIREARSIPEVGTVKLWPRIAVTAAAVIALVFGVWLYNSSHHYDSETSSAQADIAPGGNRATLTSSTGETITLSNAQTGIAIKEATLAYNDGTKINPSKLGMTKKASTITATTPRGGTYQIILPDGSKVWLNAASSIKFPSSFGKLPIRSVELSGEAYFEVAKDKQHPFVVKSRGQEIEVLGTHFNVNAYTDEGSVETTLLEGSVKVNNAVVLKPNQQAVLKDGNIQVLPVDPNIAVSWKEGQFAYQDTRLDDLMRQIARWYDVEVVYQNEALKAETFKGSVSRYSNVSRILKTLEFTGVVKFKTEGRRIIVMK